MQVNQTNRPKVSIILPVLNEIDGMKLIMPRLDQIKEWYDELIIIDGYSTDGTYEWCKSQGYPIRHQKNKGEGPVAAYNEGFEISTGDIVIVTQGDGNCIPEKIPDIIETIVTGNYDFVICSRYKGKAVSLDDTKLTRFGNWMFTQFVRILFGTNCTDALGGFRAYRRDAVVRMNLHRQPQEGWLKAFHWNISTWEMGAVCRSGKLGLNMGEIPGDEPKRVGGKRKAPIFWGGIALGLHILDELFTGSNFGSPDNRRIHFPRIYRRSIQKT